LVCSAPRTQTVSLNPEHSSPDEPEAATRAAPRQRSFVRLSVIRAAILGHPRSIICELYCRTDRMVRLWITLFNTRGIDALVCKTTSERPRHIGLKKIEDLLVPVLKGPAAAGHWHWTGVNVQGRLTQALLAEVTYRTTMHYLRELGFHHRLSEMNSGIGSSARRLHPCRDLREIAPVNFLM
jgi:transposase